MSSQYPKALRTIEHLLLAMGLALLLLYLSARIHAAVMYRAGLWSFAAAESGPSPAQAVGDQPPSPGVDFNWWSGKRVEAYVETLATKLGSPLAILSIPKVGLRVPVFEGTSEPTLNRGAGRIAGTARLGEQGNIGIAAHRNSFFRGLKDVQVGDQIELAVPHRTFIYNVDNIAIVDPSDVDVLRARPEPSLTLVTCYPFYFVGGAPQRYIVQASLAGSEPAALSEFHPEFPKLNKEKTQ